MPGLAGTLKELVRRAIHDVLVDPNVLEMPFADWMLPAARRDRGRSTSMRAGGNIVEYRTFAAYLP